MDNYLGFQYICDRLHHPTAELPLFQASYYSSAARFRHAAVIKIDTIFTNSVLII